MKDTVASSEESVMMNHIDMKFLYQKRHIYDCSGMPYGVISDADSDSTYSDF